ncbi:hypothetical protein BH20VER1_BH20VER1_21520 [soil metagenome]
MTNLKKLTLTGSLALAALVAPNALAQAEDTHVAPRGGSAGGGMSEMRDLRSTSSRMAQAGGSSSLREHRGGSWRGDGGRRGHWRGGHHVHGRHHHHHRHHRHYYPRRYYSYYPYFGHPFGYGYGYGYPYFGASASLYYNGYRPVRYANTRGSVVVQLQQQLAEAGYYRGPIDGVIGDGTRAAIRAFERDNGLRVDGRIDERLLARLRIG